MQRFNKKIARVKKDREVEVVWQTVRTWVRLKKNKNGHNDDSAVAAVFLPVSVCIHLFLIHP